MPGSIASYKLCMTPSTPIRGRADPVSALAVNGLVAVEECIDVLSVERKRIAESPGEVHSASDVFAHDGRLDGVARRRADREDSVVAHEDGGGAVVRERLDDAASDLRVADQGERSDRDLAA